MAETNPHAVVIGAGISGLTAAFRLKQAGFNVSIFEAKNRVGGRIFSVNVNGKIAELGAQNIADGGEANNIKRLIHELGLELTETKVRLDQTFYDGNDFFSFNQLLREKNFHPEALWQKLERLALESSSMQEVLDGMFDREDPLYKIAGLRLSAYEGGPIEKLSPIYIETLLHILLGGICHANPGTGNEQTYAQLESIQGGNSLLTEKMAEVMGENLHLNYPLTRVQKIKTGFLLTFREEKQVEANILVLAIPCSVYGGINFEDHIIPKEKLDAIKAIAYGQNAKILVPFSKETEERKGFISEDVISYFDPNLTILTLYLVGDKSQFSKETLLKTYLREQPMMENCFKAASPLLVFPVYATEKNFSYYNSPVGYSWPNDPYIKGSYAYIASGQEANLAKLQELNGEACKHLFTPIDNKIYFAGEHASNLLEVAGTMEAAVESGERAARMIINERFRN